jgi:DNA-binding SARP family transcriptional activator
LDPRHKGAHEYIGEAYLQANQPDKAREHLSALKAICGERCEEYQDLAKALAAYPSPTAAK